MPEFKPNAPVETREPKVEVSMTGDGVLRPGRYRFQLVVVDDSGNQSAPDVVDVLITDAQAPTARITGPKRVPFGQSFALGGEESVDAGGGTIVRYIWTLVQNA